MRVIGAVIGGVVAGVIGAAIWGAIGYATNYEVGIIAWAIGGLVGFGVAWGNQGGDAGVASGLLASIIALASIVLGKVMVILFSLQAFMGGDQLPISCVADVIIDERREAGQRVAFRPDFESESLEADYPPDVWAEAEGRWNAMSSEEQEDIRLAPALANPYFAQVHMADQLVEEYESNNKDLDWPDDWDVTTAYRPQHYPTDLWADMEARWNNMTTEGQADYRAGCRDEAIQMNREFEELLNIGTTDMVIMGLKHSFGLFDIIWAVLAVGTAFKIAEAGAVGGVEV